MAIVRVSGSPPDSNAHRDRAIGRVTRRDLGWLNPTQGIHNRFFDGSPPAGAQAIANADIDLALWSEPSNHYGAERISMLAAGIHDQFSLHSIPTDLEASRETNAEGYRIVTESGGLAWVEAAKPSADNVGSDDRPSAILLPLISELF